MEITMIVVNRGIQAKRTRIGFWPQIEQIEMGFEEALQQAKIINLDLYLYNYKSPNLAHCEIRDISQYLYLGHFIYLFDEIDPQTMAIYETSRWPGTLYDTTFL